MFVSLTLPRFSRTTTFFCFVFAPFHFIRPHLNSLHLSKNIVCDSSLIAITHSLTSNTFVFKEISHFIIICLPFPCRFVRTIFVTSVSAFLLKWIPSKVIPLVEVGESRIDEAPIPFHLTFHFCYKLLKKPIL